MQRPAFGKQKGFAVLTSVLILGLVAAGLVITLLLGSRTATRTNLLIELSKKAESLSDACGELVLLKLKDDTNYTGDESIVFEEGSCAVGLIVIQGNTGRMIPITVTVQEVTRRALLQIQSVYPQIVVESWQDISDF
jgi:hypothetical protein